MKKILGALVALTLALTMSGCFTDTDLADPSFQTLRYAGGFGAGAKFKECVPVGSKLASDDKFYRYPTSQREDVFDSDHFKDANGDGNADSGSSADHPDLKVNVGGIDVKVKMKVQFFLNTDCDPVTADGKRYPGGVIQAFHEKIGKTRNAFFNKDGSYNDGWLWSMDNYITSSVTGLTTPAVRKYSVDDAWLKQENWDSIAKDVAEGLPDSVDKAMETDLKFYKNYTVKVYGVNPEDSYQSLYRERATAAKKAETAEFNKKSRVAQAEADAAVADAQAKAKQAEIRGYGPELYRCIYLADKGMNCAQPTYIVSGTKQ